MSQETKLCRKCKETKPVDCFYKDARFPGGVDIHCSECRKSKVKTWRDKNIKKARRVSAKSYRKHPENNRRRAAAWHIKYPERAWRIALRIKFGITPEDYQLLMAKQDGKCAICSVPQAELRRRMAVDHDHETGKVRALLCSECNTGLGKFRDNPQILSNAINYIKQHNQKPHEQNI